MLLASTYLSSPPGTKFPRDQEREFYKGIRTSSGTRKDTEPGRLDAMNDLFFETLGRCKLIPHTVMDIGVSSGVTTQEWLHEFDKRNMSVTLIATDLVISVELYSIGKYLRILTEKNGHLLQIELFGMAIRTYIRRRDFFTGGFIWRRMFCRVTRSLLKKATSRETYQFVSPDMRSSDRVRLFDDDILAPTPAQFMRCADVVRVANLIQPAYFGDEQIAHAVENVRDRCRGEGCLLIVCQNTPKEQPEGTIFRMTSARQFSVVARLGNGSAVEHFFTSGA